MSTTALALRPPEKVIEALILNDFGGLPQKEQIAHIAKMTEGLELMPGSIQLLTLSGRKVPYVTKGGTDLLRRLHNVSITIIAREEIEGTYIVTARATLPDGRTDESIGAVSIENAKGDARANGVMKAETKSKRRVTLSVLGIGMLDESEVETIPGAVLPDAEPLKPRTFVDCTITSVTRKEFKHTSWADVGFTGVDSDGVEVTATLPTAADAKEAAVSLFEELKQTGEPVTIKTDIGPRNGKERICSVERMKRQTLAPEPVAVPDDHGPGF